MLAFVCCKQLQFPQLLLRKVIICQYIQASHVDAAVALKCFVLTWYYEGTRGGKVPRVDNVP